MTEGGLTCELAGEVSIEPKTAGWFFRLCANRRGGHNMNLQSMFGRSLLPAALLVITFLCFVIAADRGHLISASTSLKAPDISALTRLEAPDDSALTRTETPDAFLSDGSRLDSLRERYDRIATHRSTLSETVNQLTQSIEEGERRAKEAVTAIETEIEQFSMLSIRTRDEQKLVGKLGYYFRQTGLPATAPDSDVIEAFVNDLKARIPYGDEHELRRELRELFAAARAVIARQSNAVMALERLNKELVLQRAKQENSLAQIGMQKQALADHHRTLAELDETLVAVDQKIDAFTHRMIARQTSSETTHRSPTYVRNSSWTATNLPQPVETYSRSATRSSSRFSGQTTSRDSKSVRQNQPSSKTMTRPDSNRYYDENYRPPTTESWVNGYRRSDGTNVRGHYRTNPDGSFWNNYSSKGNRNPHTGRIGQMRP